MVSSSDVTPQFVSFDSISVFQSALLQVGLLWYYESKFREEYNELSEPFLDKYSDRTLEL